jgi:transmembrane sensor
MGSADRDESDARRTAEAAAWRIRLMEAGVDSNDEFEMWLIADPANQLAWRRVGAAWGLFGELAAAPELLEARRGALGRARDAGRRRWQPRRLLGLAAAIAAIAILSTMLFSWQGAQPDVYRTTLGERRTITLVDGSRLSLDAATEVRVKYSRHTRDLWLVAGQARFDVAHEPERPFSVTAGSERIVATGTAFAVDMVGPRILVALIEGHVVVISDDSPDQKSGQADSSANARARRIELHAGEQLVTSPLEPPRVHNVNVLHATAWQNGQLVVEDEPLSSVLDRLSRYTHRSLRVKDERVASLRVSGVFNVDDLDGIAGTLSQYLHVRVERSDDGAFLFMSDD